MSNHSLITCYDRQAEHFHHTRGFHKRPELPHIQTYLEKQSLHTPARGEHESTQSSILLDLGCGTGRIAERLDTQALDYCYTGVDNSTGMIQQARIHYPEHTFVCEDMGHYLQDQKQQSIDVILALASFHHLSSETDRLHVLHNIYRTLITDES